MKRLALLSCFFMIIFFSAMHNSFSWERYDGVLAVINNIPIIESEVDQKLEFLKKKKTIPKGQLVYEKSKIIDRFIEDALILEAAKDQSIVVNDARVLSQLEKFMKSFFMKTAGDEATAEALATKLSIRLEKKLQNKTLGEDPDLDKNLDRFINYIENTQKMDFDTFFEELRLHLRREQVMSIAIGVTPPSKKEVEDWYKGNQAKIGYEVKIKHILIKPKGSKLTSEIETNTLVNDIRKKIIAGESFEKMAQQYSQDPTTAFKGGDLGWVWLAELDPYLAGGVFKMASVNEISRSIKSGAGYHIVKYLGKRPVPIEKVENMIMYKLYTDRMDVQFKKWIEKRRTESELTIFMSDYKKG